MTSEPNPATAAPAMFTPVTESSQLPREGTGFEHLIFDMKAGRGAYRYFDKGVELDWKRYEIAKDVAAFANGMGGTILIGAEEDERDGTLLSYPGVTDAQARELTEIIGEIVEKRCFPRPLIDVMRVMHASTMTLAVNVWPFFGQIVGVSVTGAGENDYRGDKAYVYPMRLIDHTTYLTAEQVPMFMLPEVRRTLALLTAIPPLNPSDRGRLVKLMWLADGPQWLEWAVKIVEINALSNSIEVEIAPRRMSIPLDDIRQVWRDRGEWKMRVSGRLVNKGGTWTDYAPSSE